MRWREPAWIETVVLSDGIKVPSFCKSHENMRPSEHMARGLPEVWEEWGPLVLTPVPSIGYINLLADGCLNFTFLCGKEACKLGRGIISKAYSFWGPWNDSPNAADFFPCSWVCLSFGEVTHVRVSLGTRRECVASWPDGWCEEGYTLLKFFSDFKTLPAAAPVCPWYFRLGFACPQLEPVCL